MTHGGFGERFARKLYAVFGRVPRDHKAECLAWRALPPEDRDLWRKIAWIARRELEERQDARDRAEHAAEVRADEGLPSVSVQVRGLRAPYVPLDVAGNPLDMRPPIYCPPALDCDCLPELGEAVDRALEAHDRRDPVRVAAAFDCQPTSAADAVYVSQRWRDRVLAALGRPPPS